MRRTVTILAPLLATLAMHACDGKDDATAPQQTKAALYQCPEPAASLAKSGQVPLAADTSADTAKPLSIQVFKGYPPVVAWDTGKTGYVISVQDSRGGTAPLPVDSASTRVQWIEPVGMDGKPSPVAALPKCISAIQVSAPGAYIAKNVILDGDCSPVRAFTVVHDRNDGAGTASYLTWDLKNDAGGTAATGRYFWNTEVEADGAKTLLRTKIDIVVGPECL